MRLGICISLQGGWVPGRPEPADFGYVREIALLAEEAGFASLWFPDHLLNPIHGERAPCLEGWTAAAALAPLTKRVVLAHTTLCTAFRNPAVLAKQAATLQEISGGRFWLSLGAGYLEAEFRAYGLPWAEHAQRIARAREALQLIRRLFVEETVDFRGEFYALEGGALEPKPDPVPLLWYGGSSEPSRELAVERADGWLTTGGGLEDVRAKLADIEERLGYHGRTPEEFRVGVLTGLVFLRETDEEAQKAAVRTLGEEGARRARQAGLVGSPKTVAQALQAYAQLGVDPLILRFSPGLEELQRFVELGGGLIRAVPPQAP